MKTDNVRALPSGTTPPARHQEANPEDHTLVRVPEFLDAFDAALRRKNDP